MASHNRSHRSPRNVSLRFASSISCFLLLVDTVFWFPVIDAFMEQVILFPHSVTNSNRVFQISKAKFTSVIHHSKECPLMTTSSRRLPVLFQSSSRKSDFDGTDGNNLPETSVTQSTAAISTDDATIDRTSFDEAGRSLLDEQDLKRMDSMGDFDKNPNSSADKIEQMRAAIRARTASMGLEKSKVSADYIAQRQQEAIEMGAKAASEATSADTMFGGLDLSKISTEKVSSKAATKNGLWAENEQDMPSMFYDPEDELTEQERAEIDPVGQMTLVEQGLNELKNATWPHPFAALREVILMLVIIVITGALIVEWDKVIRHVYTDVLHFIPSKDDLDNYMNRFDGLDLPTGWTDNMNEDDISSLSDKIKIPEL